MKYLSSTIFFAHNFTLKITSARALIKARLNKGPAVSKVEKNKGQGYKTSKYGTLISLMSVSGCANGGDKSPLPHIFSAHFCKSCKSVNFFSWDRGGGRCGPSPGFLSLKHKNFNKSLDKASREPRKYNFTAKHYLLTVIRFSYSVSAITFLTFSGFFNFRFHSLP